MTWNGVVLAGLVVLATCAVGLIIGWVDIAQELRDRRWRREQASREGWASLLDAQGEVLATCPVVLHPTTDGQWENAQAIEFTHHAGGVAHSVRLVDANGKEYRAQLW